MKESWRKELEQQRTKIIQSAISSLVITIALSFWYYLHREPFTWHSISPIAQPGFLAVEFYGIIAYFTIGAFLFYVLRFWQLLKLICVDLGKSWRLYNDAKWVVRIILLLITQFYIVPTLIDWLNHVISFFYNAWFFLLYTSPMLGVFILLLPISFYLIVGYQACQMQRKMKMLKK